MSVLDRRSLFRAAGAAVPLLWTGTSAAESLATGQADPRLAPFDTLMSGFLTKHQVPGAALAVARHGRLVLARGFGYADIDAKKPVRPVSLFRIASVSKPFTAAAVLKLVERNKLGLDDPVLSHIKLEAYLEPKTKPDPRWKRITVRQCLHHTGGWDRDLPKTGYDPIGIPRKIARALKVPPNVTPDDIVRYMMGKPLDFDPGARYAYSNLGYLILGRVIEAVTGEKYEALVKKAILAPVGITGMHLGRALPEHRSASEVRYYMAKPGTGECLYPPRVGQKVPWPDGADNVEGYEAHGGWVASAPDLLRFATAFDSPSKSPLLKAETIQMMFARPAGRPGRDAKGKPLDSYYACGWQVVELGGGKINTFHTGFISGMNSLLVRRSDGLDWAVLLNTDTDAKGKSLTDQIDPKLHEAADAVKSWPDGDLFGKIADAGK
jgi:CubicO group peptidase (beta-lactamase class C family)